MVRADILHAVLCAIATLVIAACGFAVTAQNRVFPVKGYASYMGLLSTFVVGNTFYILQCLTRDAGVSMLAFRTQMCMTMLTTTFYLAFFRQNLPDYAPFRRWQVHLGLFAIALLTVCIFVNPGRMFFLDWYLVEGPLDVPQLHMEYGWAFFPLHGLLYALFMFCVIRVTVSRVRATILPLQSFLMLGSVLILIAASIAYVLHWTEFDYTNIIVALTSVLLTALVMNYGVMDTVPYVKHNMFALLSDPFVILLPGGQIAYANTHAERFIGLSSREMRGRSMHSVRQGFPDPVEEGTYEVQWPGRSLVSVHLSTVALMDRNGRNYGTLAVLRDVTEQNRSLRELAYLAAYDAVTGLMNADSFHERIRRYAQQSGCGLRGAYIFAVALSNADQLKGIASHRQKDEIYRSIAGYIREKLPAGFILSRFGENEFYIFSGGVAMDVMEFVSLFARTKHALFVVDGQTFTADFSMGVYCGDSAEVSAWEAIENASFALRNGLAQYSDVEIYNFHMAQQHELHKKLITSLNDIDFDADFYLEFQPIINICDNTVAAAEALLRWTHPIYGNLSPAVFIPIFEGANEMDKLGCVIVEKACDALNSWRDMLQPGFKLSINISKKQIENPVLFENIQTIIRQKGIDPLQLDFEITETATTSRLASVIDFCRAVKAMGASVSLDDFGSGDTSIAYITDFGPDKVKLDISLTDKSHVNAQRNIVLRSILDMCNALRIQVVVEHVESIDALKNLHREGFSLIQGYIFSRPLSASAFRKFYQDFRLLPID